MHGGLERVLANKLNYLHRHTNLELHILTFQQENKPPCYPIPEEITLHDLNLKYNRNLSFLNTKNVRNLYSHFVKLRKKLKEVDPDVIVVCNYEYGFYLVPLLAKKALKIKEYHSSRHFNYLTRKSSKSIFKNLIYRFTDFFESKYDHLVLLTPDELKYYNSNNKVVISNGIDKISTNQSTLTNKKVITAGRIAPVKGYNHLISSWKFVNDKHPDWVLEIYGDGAPNYIHLLQNQIKDLKLENKVLLKGATQQLNSKMLESSIYVMSSLTECYPMVLLEAMSVGLPIVSFDCPNGPRNIIKDKKNGILVEHLNESKLAEAILFLIDNPDERNRMGAFSSALIKNYSNDEVMQQWIKLFENKKLKQDKTKSHLIKYSL